METKAERVTVKDALDDFFNHYRDMLTACKKLVERMADMGRVDRDHCLDQLIRRGAPKDWSKRMYACATRGLASSPHLYGPRRVAGHAIIMRASRKALEEIAKPDNEFPFVSEDGKVSLVRAADMNMFTLNKVWDPGTGTISQKEQTRRLKRLLSGSIHDPTKDPYHIDSVVFFQDDKGRRLAELSLKRPDEANTFTVVLDPKELRKVMR